MAQSTSLRRLHIYGDESSHGGQHKFLVYGTVSCDRNSVPEILARLEKATGGKQHEWKWSGKHYRELYPDFVKAIFDCRNRFGLRYRSLVVSARHARHSEYNNHDPDLGLEKYIFLHLNHYAKTHKGDVRFSVLLDKRTSKYSAETLKRSLNARDKGERQRAYEIFEDVLDVDSKSSRLVQAPMY